MIALKALLNKRLVNVFSVQRRYLESKHFVEYFCILYIDVKQFLAGGS